MKIAFVVSLILFAVFWASTLGLLSRGLRYYSLSYSYFDEIAQAYCASQRKGWTHAIRRDCRKPKPSCDRVCQMAKGGILAQTHNTYLNVACFDAIHVKKNHPRLAANPRSPQVDPNKVGMSTYGYGRTGCRLVKKGMRPNYCCCMPIKRKPIKPITKQ